MNQITTELPQPQTFSYKQEIVSGNEVSTLQAMMETGTILSYSKIIITLKNYICIVF